MIPDDDLPAFFPEETPYGFRARLAFFFEEISSFQGGECRSLRVLEVGCGTGAMITTPLARAFPKSDFVGIDIHLPSIEKGRRTAPPNVAFHCRDVEDQASGAFDVVICSEVLEHLTDPGEMLAQLRRVLSPSGIALVTIPNGFGPKELEDLLKRRIVRLLPPLRKYLSSTNFTVASLNPAGHLQFFTRGRFRAMVRDADLEIVRYRGRRFLGGPFSSRVLHGQRSRHWNVRLGRMLPYWLVSNWMFTLRRQN